MKTNDELDLQDLCNYISNLQLLYDESQQIFFLLDFVEGCLVDEHLKFLPDDVSISTKNGSVYLVFEDANSDYIMVTFSESKSKDSEVNINYSYFKNNQIEEVVNSSWDKTMKFINNWQYI